MICPTPICISTLFGLMCLGMWVHPLRVLIAKYLRVLARNVTFSTGVIGLSVRSVKGLIFVDEWAVPIHEQRTWPEFLHWPPDVGNGTAPSQSTQDLWRGVFIFPSVWFESRFGDLEPLTIGGDMILPPTQLFISRHPAVMTALLAKFIVHSRSAFVKYAE